MQNILMKFDPATGKERPYPSHAAQWRNWHGVAAWLFDPWTGKRRNAYDVGSDVNGLLIVPAGTLGGDTGCGASKQNKHETGNDDQRPDCRTCDRYAHYRGGHFCRLCTRAGVLVCINGSEYRPADPVRLYEKEGKV